MSQNNYNFKTVKTLPVSAPALTAYGLLTFWVIWLHYHYASLMLGAEQVYSDPPAHFTSGVMVYEYLRSALGVNPLKFAEGFYVRYPKVAIGQWPPVYYVIQTLWYCLFGVSIRAAQTLSAIISLGLAWLLYRRLRLAGLSGGAFLAVLLFLAMPLIQKASWQIMSDLLTGLFVFLAVMTFSSLLQQPRWQTGCRFLLWSLLAILTKGTAWALGPFVLLAPLLAGRTGCYKASWYWGSALLMAVLAAVFFLVMNSKGMGYPIDIAYLLSRFSSAGLTWRERLAPLQPLLDFVPASVLGMATLGMFAALTARWRHGDMSPATTDALLAATWVLSQAAFLFVLPLTAESRALIPAIAAAILLVTRAMQWLTISLKSDIRQWVWLVISGCILANAGIISANRVEGFAEAAASIPYPLKGALILISSDPGGEGAFIVERLVNDPNKAGIVLRAGQMLTESNWMGTSNRPIFQSSEAMLEHLIALNISYVVLDYSVSAPMTYQRLLADAVTSHPAVFQLVEKTQVMDTRGARRGQIGVFVNPHANTELPQTIWVHLGQDRGGKVMEYVWR